VLNVIGEATVNKIDEFLLGRIVELVLGNERVNIDLHGSHLLKV